MNQAMKKLGFDKQTMKLVQVTTCEACGEEVSIYQMPVVGGPDKGKIKEFIYNCKCDDYRIANEAKASQIRAKKRTLMELFDRYSLISPELQEATLDDYMPRTRSQAIAKKSAIKYIQTFSRDRPFNLLLTGTVGVGKSHLAKVMADGVMEKPVAESEQRKGTIGYTTIFISVPKLMRKIRSSYQKDSKVSEDEIYNMLEKVDLLILDDLGVERQGDFATERLYDLIDTRQGKHTIFTTNYEYSDLLELKGERDVSRILGRGANKSSILEIEGENYRLRNMKG